MNTFKLDTLPGVGPQTALKLAKLRLHTIHDLLFHLPSRYEDRTRITPIRSARLGDHVMVEGKIIEAQIRPGRRSSLVCSILDDTGFMTLRFFHFNGAQRTQLTAYGTQIRCFGEIRMGMNGYEMVHPEYRVLQGHTPLAVPDHLTPVYPTTEGLSQNVLRQLIGRVLDSYIPSQEKEKPLQELLPQFILEKFSMPDLITALRHVHHPPPNESYIPLLEGVHPTQKRLAFEELLAHQLGLQRRRKQFDHHSAPPFPVPAVLLSPFLKQLPFSLTSAQKRVMEDIQQDLAKSRPMHRLLQGDVGAGKTVIAAMAALYAIAAGYQVALMAPTELLAEQHAQQFFRWLNPLGIKSVCLTGSIKTAARRALLAEIEAGTVQMIIGTHALFQKEVCFKQLGLVIIDEQHRFGVRQRLELREKGRQGEQQPHQLFMSATPIPRTLAMSAYADFDFSNLDELPPGRKPITTVLISQLRRDEVVTQIAKTCAKTWQVYWVCTLIEESEVLQCQAAETTHQFLSEQLSHLKIGLVHGRLKPDEKEAVMAQFKAGDINLLVSTTVIEVGVDVPNATLMVIENAERLGLAQLHQLRGRVGRGQLESYCILLYQNKLSHIAKERLQVLKNYQDGFEIARRDLELRGPGDVLGTRQAGLVSFKIADLLRDKELLPSVNEVSQLLWESSVETVDALIDRWGKQGEEYRET